MLLHINLTLYIILYYWATKFILEIPQFKICKNKSKLVLEIVKQKTGDKRKEMKQKKREKHLPGRNPPGQAQPTSPLAPGPDTALGGRRLQPRAEKQLGGARTDARASVVFPDGPDEHRLPWSL
jgi:hypothetical protein